MESSGVNYRAILVTYLRPYWRLAAVLGALLLLGLGLRLANPKVLSTFIDLVLEDAPLEVLFKYALWFTGIAIMLQGVVIAETYLAANLGQLTTNELRKDLLKQCLHLDMGFHKARTPGELIERVDGDVGTLANFFARFVTELLANVLLVVGILVVFYTIDWRVGLAETVFVLLTLLLVVRMRDVAVPHNRAARQAAAELYGFLEERLSGTEDVRANGAVAYVMRRLYHFSRQRMRTRVKAAAVGISNFSASRFFFVLGTVAVLALGAFLYQDELITIGTVYLIYRYTELLIGPVESIGRQFQDLQQAGAGVVRIQDLLAVERALKDYGEQRLPSGVPLALRFEDVTFRYMDEKPEAALNANVLTDIDFELPPGKVLGLLGRTGSGKTTLARLLFRFYDPQKGQIKYNQVALPEIQLAALRERVSLVTQDIQLFNGSVRDNLTLFDPHIDDQEILNTLDDLGLRGWLDEMPSGLDAQLAPGGTGLSAGEAQLLAFVRVFLRDPGLVVLDEASSRLDQATEHLLEQAVDRLLADRTAIIIAHRLSTVQRADYIMILEGGQIAEFGERQKLAADENSNFSRLLRVGMEEALV